MTLSSPGCTSWRLPTLSRCSTSPLQQPGDGLQADVRVRRHVPSPGPPRVRAEVVDEAPGPDRCGCRGGAACGARASRAGPPSGTSRGSSRVSPSPRRGRARPASAPVGVAPADCSPIEPTLRPATSHVATVRPITAEGRPGPGQGVRRRSVAEPAASAATANASTIAMSPSDVRGAGGVGGDRPHRVDGVGQRQHVGDRVQARRAAGRAARAARRAGTAAARTPAGTARPGTRSRRTPTEQPERRAEHGVDDGDERAAARRAAGDVEAAAPRSRSRSPPRPARRRAAPKASAYPPSRSPLPSGIVSSRSSVPVRRSRRVAMLVTRNITTNGKTPSSGAPMWSKTGVSLVDPGQQPEQHAGHDDEQAERAGVVPDLAQHAAAGGERSARGSCRHRSACGPRARAVDEGEEGLLDVGRRRWRRARRARVSSASSRPSRMSSSRSQRVASSMTWLLTSSVTPSPASRRNRSHRSRRSTGSSPTVGSSSTSSSGVPSRAAAERDPGELAAGEPVDPRRRVVGRATTSVEHARRPRRRGGRRATPTHGGEVARGSRRR